MYITVDLSDAYEMAKEVRDNFPDYQQYRLNEFIDERVGSIKITLMSAIFGYETRFKNREEVIKYYSDTNNTFGFNYLDPEKHTSWYAISFDVFREVIKTAETLGVDGRQINLPGNFFLTRNTVLTIAEHYRQSKNENRDQ